MVGFWVFMYSAPSKSKFVNKAELEYIEQDKDQDVTPVEELKEARKMSFLECFSYKQTWAFAFGKFMTDGVWWFFLFWTPSYLNTQFGIKTSEGLGMALFLHFMPSRCYLFTAVNYRPYLSIKPG